LQPTPERQRIRTNFETDTSARETLRAQVRAWRNANVPANFGATPRVHNVEPQGLCLPRWEEKGGVMLFPFRSRQHFDGNARGTQESRGRSSPEFSRTLWDPSDFSVSSAGAVRWKGKRIERTSRVPPALLGSRFWRAEPRVRKLDTNVLPRVGKKKQARPSGGLQIHGPDRETPDATTKTIHSNPK